MAVKEKTKQNLEAQELLKIITLELETLQLKRNTASPEIVRKCYGLDVARVLYELFDIEQLKNHLKSDENT